MNSLKVLTLLTLVTVLSLSAVASADTPLPLGSQRAIAGIGDIYPDGRITRVDRDLFIAALIGTWQPPCPLEWNMDLNGDGKVNFRDLPHLEKRMGQTVQPQIVTVGDANGDGSVTLSDLQDGFGAGCDCDSTRDPHRSRSRKRNDRCAPHEFDCGVDSGSLGPRSCT